MGAEFIEEVLTVFDALKINPLLNCRQHPTKNIRWRYPKRFPYRVIYEVIEANHLVIIAAVVHAARQDAFGEAASDSDVSTQNFGTNNWFSDQARR
ncbi:MAG TPA: type II toxin-antitoxin system RelE/ParE family toxin [Pyrinomonadaceae bacterium]|nr:type II toxin-antitoxin system RelE/ParE family toxin [Pyrinomonadaceae bacterium]